MVKYALKEFSVSTPLFRTRTTISGTFRNKQDSFDTSRHQINVKSVSGVRLCKLQRDLPTVKTRLGVRQNSNKGDFSINE